MSSDEESDCRLVAEDRVQQRVDVAFELSGRERPDRQDLVRKEGGEIRNLGAQEPRAVVWQERSALEPRGQ